MGIGVADSIDDAWIALLSELVTNGKETAPRGMKVKELRAVTIHLQDPAMNVLQNPGRKLNYYFMVAEFIWQLFGHRDVASISAYNSQIAQFSDDGEVFFGAYGPKITGQLAHVIRRLQEDPDTRQAVIDIWKQEALTTKTKDVPCLTAETLIRSPEGDVTIQALAQMFANGNVTRYPVYSFNVNSRVIEFAWCTSAWRSGCKRVTKITFTDGSILRCTPDHRVYQKLRYRVGHEKPQGSSTFVKEVDAGELRPGDRVWAMHFIKTKRQGRPAFIGHLSSNWSGGNQQAVHTAYYEFLHGRIPKGFDVHHKDDDKQNNRGSNLTVLAHAEHSAIGMFGDDNPMRRETAEAKVKRVERLRETYRNKGWKVKPLETNHTVMSIEEEPLFEDVYDFVVDRNHNAVIGTGVIVHNCTLNLQFFVREGKVELHVNMRSNDIWLGFPYDVFNFTSLQRYVASALQLPAGEYVHHVGSMHLYERHYADAERVLAAGRYSPHPDCAFPVPTHPVPYEVGNVFAWLANKTLPLEVARGYRGALPEAWQPYATTLIHRFSKDPADKFGFLTRLLR